MSGAPARLTAMPPDTVSAALLDFNVQLLDQALALVAAFEAPGAPPYAKQVGPHLRHVIEHHEALLFGSRPGEVDYDSRARDRALEASPALARRRLLALQARLQACAHQADPPLQVRGLCGLHGETPFTVGSTLNRELAFVASHAVHHYALLQAHCRQHGLVTAEVFGVAPATVAHARADRITPTSPQEPACPLASTTA